MILQPMNVSKNENKTCTFWYNNLQFYYLLVNLSIIIFALYYIFFRGYYYNQSDNSFNKKSKELDNWTLNCRNEYVIFLRNKCEGFIESNGKKIKISGITTRIEEIPFLDLNLYTKQDQYDFILNNLLNDVMSDLFIIIQYGNEYMICIKNTILNDTNKCADEYSIKFNNDFDNIIKNKFTLIKLKYKSGYMVYYEEILEILSNIKSIYYDTVINSIVYLFMHLSLIFLIIFSIINIYHNIRQNI